MFNILRVAMRFGLTPNLEKIIHQLTPFKMRSSSNTQPLKRFLFLKRKKLYLNIGNRSMHSNNNYVRLSIFLRIVSMMDLLLLQVLHTMDTSQQVQSRM